MHARSTGATREESPCTCRRRATNHKRGPSRRGGHITWLGGRQIYRQIWVRMHKYRPLCTHENRIGLEAWIHTSISFESESMLATESGVSGAREKKVQDLHTCMRSAQNISSSSCV